jgi:hypothetical protein
MMCRLALLICLLVLVVWNGSVMGQINLELFSDSNCTQPFSQYLAANSMIDDLNYINSLPRSSIAINSSLALSDPSYCVPRQMSSFPYTGYVNVACRNSTATRQGSLYMYTAYNATANCDLWWVGDVMEYSLQSGQGSTPGTGCFAGYVRTSWFNQTSVNHMRVPLYGRFACTSFILPPADSPAGSGSNEATTNKAFPLAVISLTAMFIISALS